MYQDFALGGGWKRESSYLNRNPDQFRIVAYKISLKTTYLSILRQNHVLVFSAMRLSWPQMVCHSQPCPWSCALGRDAISHRRQVWSFRICGGPGLFNQRVTGTHLRKPRMNGQSSSCSKSHGCIRTLSSSNDGSLVKWNVDSPDAASRIVNCFRMGYVVRGLGSSVTNSQSRM